MANAVYDGTDAVMLSGETAQGKYPVEALQMMAHIIETTEQHLDYELILQKSGDHLKSRYFRCNRIFLRAGGSESECKMYYYTNGIRSNRTRGI